jgi:hypothetical protein
MVAEGATMNRLVITFLLSFGFTAAAHVGSPNVFFEGRAGSYTIYSVVRPPAALPGSADVSVQVRQSDATSVSLLPVLWQTGREGSPAAVLAERVAGATNLWSGQVWFLRPGSYTLQISVNGPRGRGEAIVPVNVLGMLGRQMSPARKTGLLLMGAILFISALVIVRVVARDASLQAGAKPDLVQFRASRYATGVAVLLLTTGIAAGAFRWRSMDLLYRSQGVQKPEPVSATVLSESQRVLLELQPAEQSLGSASWTQLVPDHGKLMHMFLIRAAAQDVFAHLHPLRQDGQTFLLELPPLPSGNYQLYGELTFENGLNQTLLSDLVLPEPLSPLMLPPVLATNAAGDVICGVSTLLTNEPGKVARDMDDSWHLQQNRITTPDHAQRAHPNGALYARLMGGYSLVFENAQAVEAGRDKLLRFAAFAPDGSEVPLQLYMGMPGHAALRREDGSVFAHLHPSGSFSMASQEIFRERLAMTDTREPAARANLDPARDQTNRVLFPYEFPNPGKYRLWVQVRVGGRVLTGVYDILVQNSG